MATFTLLPTYILCRLEVKGGKLASRYLSKQELWPLSMCPGPVKTFMFAMLVQLASIYLRASIAEQDKRSIVIIFADH